MLQYPWIAIVLFQKGRTFLSWGPITSCLNETLISARKNGEFAKRVFFQNALDIRLGHVLKLAEFFSRE